MKAVDSGRGGARPDLNRLKACQNIRLKSDKWFSPVKRAELKHQLMGRDDFPSVYTGGFFAAIWWEKPEVWRYRGSLSPLRGGLRYRSMYSCGFHCVATMAWGAGLSRSDGDLCGRLNTCALIGWFPQGFLKIEAVGLNF